MDAVACVILLGLITVVVEVMIQKSGKKNVVKGSSFKQEIVNNFESKNFVKTEGSWY